MNTHPKAKRILCFGDSYTWGYIPGTDHQRFPSDIRWTGVLQEQLGKQFEIIEEGLNSRSLSSDDPRAHKEGRNGLSYLIPCLDSHEPLDLVLLMLGTNELKDIFDSTIEQITEVFEEYLKIITGRVTQSKIPSPKVLIITPPLLDLSKKYALDRYSKSVIKQKSLTINYKKLADKYGCSFYDSTASLKVGVDGVHIEEKYHKMLGTELSKIILTIF